MTTACTGFGAIRDDGTIIGKNRDYFYGPQTVGLLNPLPQLLNWHGNHDHHANIFFALSASDGVSMGVNQHGLVAIEEDAHRPPHKKTQQRFQEPLNHDVSAVRHITTLPNEQTDA